MRVILLILLATTTALALVAAFAHPQSTQRLAAFEARQLLAAAALRPARGLALPSSVAPGPIAQPQAAFALPLMERPLPAGRRTEPLDADLIEAMDRIEPVMDPTRLEGPFAPAAFRIWPGTASLADVFGEHWRLASDDPNVQQSVRTYALAWHRAGPLGCDDFVKNRAHAVGAPSLAALALADCERIRTRAAMRRDDAAPLPIVAAPLSLAAFAAPLPGARMSSGDFWAAQREKVEAARDRLRRRWQAARNVDDGIGLRN